MRVTKEVTFDVMKALVKLSYAECIDEPQIFEVDLANASADVSN
jgi:hypothetical protein